MKAENKVKSAKDEAKRNIEELKLEAEVEKEKADKQKAFEESERKRIYYDPTEKNVVTDGNHATANMPEHSITREHGP